MLSELASQREDASKEQNWHVSMQVFELKVDTPRRVRLWEGRLGSQVL